MQVQTNKLSRLWGSAQSNEPWLPRRVPLDWKGLSNECYVLSRRSRALLNPEREYGLVLMLATAMGTVCTPSSQICTRVLGLAPYGNEHQCPRVSKKGCKDLEAHRVTRKCYYFQWSSAVSSQCYLETGKKDLLLGSHAVQSGSNFQFFFRRLMCRYYNLMLVEVSYFERLVSASVL
jgi:hypothetical protein